ncbi:MAG: sodium-dependent bicarbonate transport family permease [Alphaproteobacteria bacterium]|nr:sodium-dependent bicarbonate transport family permease [Alphaproteobacteria bacterium]
MRLALAKAKTAVYLPLSLAMTFPCNVTFGIPLYHSLAAWRINSLGSKKENHQ